MKHIRKDLKYNIVKGRAHFNRAAYACIITEENWDCTIDNKNPIGRRVFHVESFFGNNGVTTRAAARRFGSSICKGQCLNGFRDTYLSSIFTMPESLQ